MSYEAPYEGLRVVDLSQGVAGPYAAMLLAQHGADVIKVEPPEGDWSRLLGVRYGDHTAFSLASNLGKRAIAVDLKTAEGREIVHRLAARADVFLEGFRPGVAARLGVGWDEIARLNPGILYVSISGFGQTGPERQRPAMDPILQAFSGLIATNRGPDGIPHRVTPVVVDMATALYTFQALSAALYARRDERRGRYIDASLLQSAAALQVVHITAHHLEGGRMRPGITPGGSFEAADGWMYVITLHQADFRALCAALEIPWDPAMLRWEAGPRETDGAWAPHWYRAVWASNRFAPPDPQPPLRPGLRPVVEAAMPAFARLRARKLIPIRA